VEEMKEICDVTREREVFHLRAASKVLQSQFAHSYGIWRMHYHTMEALHLLIFKRKHRARGIALLCQLCRAAHQAALDGNSWVNAGLLVPTRDPTAQPRFGGTHAQLAAVTDWNKAVEELETGLKGRGNRRPPAQKEKEKEDEKDAKKKK